MMPGWALMPSVDQLPSPAVSFNSHTQTNSDDDCDLPDNEDVVDLRPYMDYPGNASTMPTRRNVEIIIIVVPASGRPTETLSQSIPAHDLISHSDNRPRFQSPAVSNNRPGHVQNETNGPQQPVSSRRIPQSETNIDSSSDRLVPDIETNVVATDDESEVDIETVEATINPSCSTDKFVNSIPSTSTASTSQSTIAKNNVVCNGHVFNVPLPAGRPWGSVKQSAGTGHASASASLPSCSNSETENTTASNSVLVVTGNDNDVDIESVEATINSSCSSDECDDSIPSTSTASTSHSTKAKNNVVCNCHVFNVPLPAGRPWGSVKQSAGTGHASASSSLPSCSNSVTENTAASNSVLVVTGNDSDVDIEPVEATINSSCSSDECDDSIPSSSTASTSHSTKAKNNVVCNCHVFNVPLPAGRPWGSVKQSAGTGHASASASLPSCSNSETENTAASNSVLVVTGNDSDVDIEPVEATINSSCLSDECDDSIPSTSTASTSHSTKAKNNMVCNCHVFNVPLPAGRPWGSVKQSAGTGHASASASLPSCSNSETENTTASNSVLVVTGNDSDVDIETVEATINSSYSSEEFDNSIPVFTGNDIDVDIDTVEATINSSCSSDECDDSIPSTSTASTSHSTKSKNNVVCNCHVFNVPLPAGRPWGSVKQSAGTGHASASASLPSCSNSETENTTASNSVLVVTGNDSDVDIETVEATINSSYSSEEFDNSIPVFTGNDIDVDIDTVEATINSSCSSDECEDSIPSTSTASTSHSTKSKNNVVCNCHVFNVPLPAGRSWGSVKQSAGTGHASASASLPSCSNSETENTTASNSVLVVTSNDSDVDIETVEATIYSSCSSDEWDDSIPVFTGNDIDVDIETVEATINSSCSSDECDDSIPVFTGNDIDMDIETVEATINSSCSSDEFDNSIPSTSTASTSQSTKAKTNVVCNGHVFNVPLPACRPRGSVKQSAGTGHASTSASLPSFSKSETEYSTASNSVAGRKRKLVLNDTTTAQSQSTYTPVPSTSTNVNFQGNNQLERNHRQELAGLFTDLRDKVPRISSNATASKFRILREATSHILNLEKKIKLQENEASKLLQKQYVLKFRLQELQSKISGGLN